MEMIVAVVAVAIKVWHRHLSVRGNWRPNVLWHFKVSGQILTLATLATLACIAFFFGKQMQLLKPNCKQPHIKHHKSSSVCWSPAFLDQDVWTISLSCRLACIHCPLVPTHKPFIATQDKRRKTRKTTYRFQVRMSTSLFNATGAGVVCLMRNSSFRRFLFSFLVQVLLHCKSQGSSNVVSSFRSFLGTCSKEASCPMICDTSPKCPSFWLTR